jgi:N-acetyl-beta-hexosaminidase
MEKNYLGVMLDVSRNGVMKVEKVKEFVDLIAKMGYNALELYTEDTFEVNNEPYFGYLRGRYSKADLKEINAYCLSKGVELIPCVQTLAHLNQIFQWEEYKPINEIKDILLVENERTYELIENIFSTIKECFTSR